MMKLLQAFLLIVLLSLPGLAQSGGVYQLEESYVFYANTHNPSTAGCSDADTAPTYRVYEAETGPLTTGTMALLDGGNTCGFYSEAFTVAAASGYEVNKTYVVYITGAVSSITGTDSEKFIIRAAEGTSANQTTILGRLPTTLVSGRIDASVGAMAANVITAASSAADFVTEVTAPTSLLTIPKNTAYTNYPIRMVTSAGVAVTGQTVTCDRAIDAGAFADAAAGASATEISLGYYRLSLLAGDLNGNSIIMYCTGTGGSGTSVPYQQIIFTQR